MKNTDVQFRNKRKENKKIHDRSTSKCKDDKWIIYQLKLWQISNTLEQRSSKLIKDEIKIILNSGNASYNSVQNHIYFCLLSGKNQMLTVPVFVLHGCETWSLTLTQEKSIDNMAPRKVYRTDEITAVRIKLGHVELQNL
jgi:hypothetical protein